MAAGAEGGRRGAEAWLGAFLFPSLFWERMIRVTDLGGPTTKGPQMDGLWWRETQLQQGIFSEHMQHANRALIGTKNSFINGAPKNKEKIKRKIALKIPELG